MLYQRRAAPDISWAGLARGASAEPFATVLGA